MTPSWQAKRTTRVYDVFSGRVFSQQAVADVTPAAWFRKTDHYGKCRVLEEFRQTAHPTSRLMRVVKSFLPGFPLFGLYGRTVTCCTHELEGMVFARGLQAPLFFAIGRNWSRSDV